MRAALLLLVAVVAACAPPQVVPRIAPGAQFQSITVTSPVVQEGGHIPVDSSCDGSDVIPELVLSAPPAGTQSLLLLVDDPDAASGSFTHLLAFNVAPETHKVPSAPDLGGLGPEARYGKNDFGSVRYAGPCPPKGEQHRYRYRVLALDTMLRLEEGADRAHVDRAMDGHILGEGVLTGTFGH